MDRESAIFFGWVFGIVAAIILAIIGLCEVHGRHTCHQYQQVTGVETRWVALDVCYVNYKGEWLRYGEYRVAILVRDAGVAQ